MSRLRRSWIGALLLVSLLFAPSLIAMCAPTSVLSSAGSGEPLLTTTWGQGGDYKLFTPVDPTTDEHEPLGCWSVAIAQILNYLSLQPHGHQHYEGDVYTIDEYFDHIFDWELITDALDEHSAPEEVEETALFCYYVAVVIQKKFGGGYMGNSDVIRAELHDHCQVSTTRVSTAYHTHGEIESFISTELEQGRPLMLYIYPHAMVIDGYRVVQGSFEVHINFGWYGSGDDWHGLWEEIDTPIYTFADPDRWIMAVRPDIPSPTASVFRVIHEGNVYADRAYYGADFRTGGADIAEHIEVSELVEPGDVVEMDPDHPGYYRKSRGPYSTLVAGVVSTAPGMTMGAQPMVELDTRSMLSTTFELGHDNLSISRIAQLSARESPVPTLSLALRAEPWLTDLSLDFTIQQLQSLIEQPKRPLLALMGVVPVKATTENGPIKPGDLLTTSSTPGYAMRCDDPQEYDGAIIGKAVEPLEKGAGVIEMLLMR